MSKFGIARKSIYLHASIDGDTHKFYPQISLDKINLEWSPERQKFKGEGEYVNAMNQFLTRFQQEVDTFILDAKRNGEKLSKNDVVDFIQEKFFQKSDEVSRNKYFMRYLNYQIETLAHRPGTIKTYKVTYNNLLSYLDQFKRTDVRFVDMNKRWFNEYENWLKLKGTSSTSTIDKHKKILKTFLNKALEEGLHNNTDFLKVKRAKRSELAEDTIHLFLNESEVESIANLSLTGIEKKVISAFIFSCYTGVRFEDTKSLSKENIIYSEEEGYWLSYRQVKSGVQVDVPIIKERAIKIIQENEYQFPKITNYKANVIIRKVLNDHQLLQEKIKVQTSHTKGTFRKSDLISYHISRKSFCTNMWLKDIPNNLIMAASGHKSEAVFLSYIKADQKRKAQGLMRYKDY
jgi:integrase